MRHCFFSCFCFFTKAEKKFFEGQSLIAEIGPDKKGNGYQIKQIITECLMWMVPDVN